MSTDEHIVRDEEILAEFKANFYLITTIQGRLAYLLMSVHAVNPSILARFTSCNPTPFLFYNMIYGTAAHLHCRPHMQLLGDLHRFIFSVLGSLMFNHCTMQVYDWLVDMFPERPHLLTIMGFLSGRLMMLYFLSYLYHVDTRSIVGGLIRRDFNYESMYL